MYKGKIIHLFGARQVGKSTLLNQLSESIKKTILRLNADDADLRQVFHNESYMN